MEVRVLGCSGGVGGLENRTTALRVDDDILIDCGTGVGSLQVDELMAIDHVFITHAHLDHICFLPFLVDTVGEFRKNPINVHATPETLRIIRSHIFNWVVWPDFSAIPDRTRPMMRFHELHLGESFETGGRRISALPALHTVPAVGYRIQCPTGSLAFSGDTTLCEPLVQSLNSMKDLKVFIIETAFTNAQHDLALAARHLCPDMLFKLLDDIEVSPEVYVTHLKPVQAGAIRDEITEYGGRLRPRFLESDLVFQI